MNHMTGRQKVAFVLYAIMYFLILAAIVAFITWAGFGEVIPWLVTGSYPETIW